MPTGKRLLLRACISVALLSLFLSQVIPARAEASDPAPLTAPSAALMDAADGRVLWQKGAHERRSIASTTKIVTALVVIRTGHIDDLVTVSPRAAEVGASDPLVSRLGLKSGQRISVRHLLYGLLLPSANDAALALAEHFGGSVEGFVEMMNLEAVATGAANTRFRNPHGLDEPGHFSSAYDLALIARRAMSDPLFREIVATPRYEIPAGILGASMTIENRNLLLGSFQGADGIKTGQTLAAGRVLVASASRSEEQRIAVVIGSTDSFVDARALLEYGFSGFRRFRPAPSGSPWAMVTLGDGSTFSVFPGRDFSLLVEGSAPDPSVRYEGHGESARFRVTVSGGEEFEIAAEHRCITGECRRPRQVLRPIERLWDLLAPLARVLAELA